MEALTHLTFDSKQEEFVQYVIGILNDALSPYSHQVKGTWVASTIRQNLLSAFARSTELRGGTLKEEQQPVIKDYEKDGSIKEVSERMSAEMSNEVFEYYRHHAKGVVYTIDMRAYSEIIKNKLEELLPQN